MKAFSKIPFYRILIPFVLGIICCVFAKSSLHSNSLLLSFTIIILLIVFKNKLQKKGVKWAWFILMDIVVFNIAFMITQQKDARLNIQHVSHFASPDSDQFYIARLNEIPVDKEKSSKCYLKMLYVKKGDSYLKINGIIIAYIKKPNSLKLTDASELIVFKGKLQEIQPPKNPLEFDYRTFLANQQIYYSTFLQNNSFLLLINEVTRPTIWEIGLKIKSNILSRLKKVGLSSDAYGICAALITGYDDDIDKDVMSAFSHSGTLHVLSVSGLHTGAIFLVLNFIFNFFDKNKKWKLVRFIFVTLSLWSFALLTGFAAPVLRAVIMFNLFGVGEIYFRNKSSNRTNILLVSAFILLIFNPYYLFEIGFLLSYFAIFGLIYFQPLISGVFNFENKILRYGWSTIASSISATISTLPITLFFFKQFPLWFFVTNIVVVPVCIALLGLTVFAMFNLSFITLIINLTVEALIKFIDLFDSEKIGYIDSIDFRTTDAIFLCILIPIVTHVIENRRFLSFTLALSLIITWQLINLLQIYSSKKSSGFHVYSTKNESHYIVKNTTACYHYGSLNASFNNSIKSHLISFNYPHVSHKTFNHVKYKSNEFLILNSKNKWPQMNFNHITGLIVSHNFKLNESDFKQFPNLKVIISDATNNKYTNKIHQELSRKFNIEFYDANKKGAYILALK